MIEKWQEIVGKIKDNFIVEEFDCQHLDDEGGVDVEFIVFRGPLGLMRLELVSKPVVIDKKVVFSKRIGSESKVDYVYNQNEKSHHMTAYKWDNLTDDWLEIEAGSFAA